MGALESQTLSPASEDARYHDVHRVNIRTGELTLVQENPDFLGFITDDDFNLRFAVRMTTDGGEEVFKPGPAGGWEPYRTVAMEDTLTSGHVGFDKSGAVEYRTESRGRDTAALVAVDLETEVETVLVQDDRVDVGGVMTHPTEKHPQAVAFSSLTGSRRSPGRAGKGSSIPWTGQRHRDGTDGR